MNNNMVKQTMRSTKGEQEEKEKSKKPPQVKLLMENSDPRGKVQE